MTLLYHWRRENYVEDVPRLDPASGLELEQSSPVFAQAQPGERLWAFTRRGDGTYVLAAQLRVARVEETGPGAHYGRYRVVPRSGTTVLYNVQQGLGLFVRSLVGLDREAAKQSLGGFLEGKNLQANQIEFLNLIVNHLTEHGIMPASLLYESPYTDFSPHGVEGVFSSDQVDQLVGILEEVRRRAVA